MFVSSSTPSEGLSAPQAYVDRKRDITVLATGIDDVPVEIEYTSEENETWRTMMALLGPLWERHAAVPLQAAKFAMQLPTDHVPQLTQVSERLDKLTGFRFASVPGTVSRSEFFAALGRRIFPSTQFVRWAGAPLYTPEPDVVHEVAGHAHALANNHLAELHRLAGRAANAAGDGRLLESIAAVFWYTAEFGVLSTADGLKAYGAGLLSSPGELAWFADNAQVRPFNISEMIATSYDISRFQPVLFAAESLQQVVDVAGTFFADIASTLDTSAGEPLIDLRDVLNTPPHYRRS